MEAMLVIRSIMSRLVFFAHSLLSIYLYNTYHSGNKDNWFMLVPVVFLLIESFITIGYRKGVEHRYFWSSGFLYITSVIPLIWLIELDILDSSTHKAQTVNITANHIETQLEHQDVRKICQLGLIMSIIISRWLMPRGVMTRDQLSNLLLEYVGNSADILDLFTTFDEEELKGRRAVIIGVIFVFTWSMYHFTFTIITMKNDAPEKQVAKVPICQKKVFPSSYYSGKKMQTDTNLQKDYIDLVKSIEQEPSVQRGKRGRGRKDIPTPLTESKTTAINDHAANPTDVIKRREIHEEVYQIVVIMLMLDGPFLILRAFLIFHYFIYRYTLMFFAVKNAIIIILRIYRLLILSCSGKDEEVSFDRETAEEKLRNVQLAFEDLKIEIAQVRVK